MDGKDGSSRKELIKQWSGVKYPEVLDASLPSLLRRLTTTAGFIRYYNFDNRPDGYFSQLLNELDNPQIPPGEMEPSQALLLTFMRQLHQLAEQFNRRWEDLPRWYLDELLGIADLPARPATVWTRLEKNVPGTVIIPQNTLFMTEEKEPATFRLTEETTAHDAMVGKIYSLSFETTGMRPGYAGEENDWGNYGEPGKYVAAIKMKELSQEKTGVPPFAKEPDRHYSQTPGCLIVSPSLLLREGKRTINLTIETETTPLSDFLKKMETSGPESHQAMDAGQFRRRILDNLFFLQISTTAGWSEIPYPWFSRGAAFRDDLTITFTLPAGFPPICCCEDELHGCCTPWPALKIYLNFDAWLYPYSWIKEIRVRRIIIRSGVENITGLLIYNELGQVDNAHPFNLFGNNTGCGAWFAVGNYEMAVKPTQSVSLRTNWSQLPGNRGGMEEYYQAYRENTGNHSFQISARFLSGYTWQEIPHGSYPLFSTHPHTDHGDPLPGAPLAPVTSWDNIPTGKMPPTGLNEELYDYSLASQSGFLSFRLDAPLMGFGEKQYRKLFTEYMVKSSRKKNISNELNPPYIPVVEKMTLSYQAEEVIDLRTNDSAERNAVYHLYPFGKRKVYPHNDNQAIPLIWSLETAAHLLISLKTVNPAIPLRLFLRFGPVQESAVTSRLPQVEWYYGDNYSWRKMPDDAILRDTTSHLLTDGYVDFKLPEEIDGYTCEETIWLRAEITRHAASVPPLLGIDTNVAPLEEVGSSDETDRTGNSRRARFIPTGHIPGITAAVPITAFAGGRGKESIVEKQIRIAGYICHHGRAITPRDYEQLTLQAFPSIAKAKCLPAYDGGERPGAVTLVVLPVVKPVEVERQPKVPASDLFAVESLLRRCASPAVRRLYVINPQYEEVIIRCRIHFREGASTPGINRMRLNELCGSIVAPWMASGEPPRLDHTLTVKQIRTAMLTQDYIAAVDDLTVIRLTETENGLYRLSEYNTPEEVITPSVPYGVLIPTGNHLFRYEGYDPFGIGEMEIGHTFIL